jgi:hypothetical protein
MKMTKEQFYYRLGFWGALTGVQMSESEAEIAWHGYQDLPENPTESQMDEATHKTADDIIACRGSVKE